MSLELVYRKTGSVPIGWSDGIVETVSNVLKSHEKGDRILILAGGKHKWTLDMLSGYTPDFEAVSSWDYLKQP